MKLENKCKREIILLSYNDSTLEYINHHTISINSIMQFNDLDVAMKSMQDGTSTDKRITVFISMEDMENYIETNNITGYENNIL
jgi:hypothetical protein